MCGVKCEYLGGQLMSVIQMISLQCLDFIEPVDDIQFGSLRKCVHCVQVTFRVQCAGDISCALCR